MERTSLMDTGCNVGLMVAAALWGFDSSTFDPERIIDVKEVAPARRFATL